MTLSISNKTQNFVSIILNVIFIEFNENNDFFYVFEQTIRMMNSKKIEVKIFDVSLAQIRWKFYWKLFSVWFKKKNFNFIAELDIFFCLKNRQKFDWFEINYYKILFVFFSFFFLLTNDHQNLLVLKATKNIKLFLTIAPRNFYNSISNFSIKHKTLT